MPVLIKTPILILFLSLLILPGCAGVQNPANLYYMSWDANTYFRPGLVYERISHDSSSHASVNYFRWLHGPIPYQPGPSEYARNMNAARMEPQLSPQLRNDPSLQDQIPQSGPQFQSEPSLPQAPPVEIIVPPELAPYPERNSQRPVLPSPVDGQLLQTPPQDGPTAYRSLPQKVQPASYRGSSGLSMTNIIFARP